ncbi:hypothetical protein [Thermococcus sp.]|uniref:hypothetical protein n=1 Tax=Thermococcus sp. TaxID=35749 RepID=UPI00260F242C|nr:hypothetical protein [Thermococcus sp.]
MRVFIKDYLLPWLFTIGFWVVIWVLVPGKEKNLSLQNVVSIFLLLIIFLLVALYFVGRTLERYGYSRRDVRRLPEIIEKTHGRLYLPKEIFDTITRALIFWGLFSSAVLLTKNPPLGSPQRHCDVCADIFVFRPAHLDDNLGVGISSLPLQASHR